MSAKKGKNKFPPQDMSEQTQKEMSAISCGEHFIFHFLRTYFEADISLPVGHNWP